MDKTMLDLQLGALLYDFPQIVARTGIKEEQISSLYLRNQQLLGESHPVYEILDEMDLQQKKESIDPNSFVYLITEASNIASGSDHRHQKSKEAQTIRSVFDHIRTNKKSPEQAFKLEKLDEKSFQMPKLISCINVSNSDYAHLLNELEAEIKKTSSPSPVHLLQMIEKYMSNVPAHGYSHADISYYDHAKLTAAIASCLYEYHRDAVEEYHNISSSEERSKDKFLVVSGEFSGIQDFIYTITSKMAMKSLRGRSFFLELFAEHIIDEILHALSMNRINLIYSGGSQFYLLLPNTEQVEGVLKNCKKIINDYLLKEIGSKLYFELVYTATTAEELGNGLGTDKKTDNKIGQIFRRLSIQSSANKISRYEKDQLHQLFDENSSLNKVHSYTKECVICRKAEKEEILNANAKKYRDVELCNSCAHFIKLGESIARLYQTDFNRDHYIAEIKSDSTSEKGVELPTLSNGSVILCLVDGSEKMQAEQAGNLYRYYVINSLAIKDKFGTNIQVGNYNIKHYSTDASEDSSDKKNKYQLIEFKDLVKKSIGIERLAVLRADLDDLGTLFMSGFADESSEYPYESVTLAKSAVLSKYLSDFFKRKINLILEKNDAAKPDNQYFKKYCDIFGSDAHSPRNIVLVYSGGDDVFAIGTWNDIIEFSIDLRTAFKECCNSKITLSAGIGFFSESYPVYQMAEQTGELEKLAKSFVRPQDLEKSGNAKPTKDAVALFGKSIHSKIEHVYPWDDFVDKVLNEKYTKLKEITTTDDQGSPDKVVIGKSKLYKLMDLINKRLREDDKLDIAHFAYTLARIKTTKDNEDNFYEFKKQLMLWMKNKEDAKQLLTAIYLMLYEIRD